MPRRPKTQEEKELAYARTRRWAENNREKYLEGKRRVRLKTYHNWTVEGYEAMWDAQGGRCYLCRALLEFDKQPSIDHDHNCHPNGYSCEKCRRGITCNRCNRGIGFFNDDPDLMRQVAANLEAVMQGEIRVRTS